MTALTNEIIIAGLNESYDAFFELLKILAPLLLIAIISITIKFARQEKKKYIPLIIIGTVIFSCICAFPAWDEFLKCNAIQYSLKNQSWSVEADTIIGKDVSRNGPKGKISGYYVVLKNHGRTYLESSRYHQLSEGDNVYVTIVQGRFGGTYVINFYSMKNYIYNP